MPVKSVKRESFPHLAAISAANKGCRAFLHSITPLTQ